MMNFLLIPSLVALGVYFLGRSIGKRFDLSANSYLGFAIISFVLAFIFHAKGQDVLLKLLSNFPIIDPSTIVRSVIGLCFIALLFIFLAESRRKIVSVDRIDLNKAIENITQYNQQMQIVRDVMNEKGKVPSKTELAAMRITYERLVYPYIDALKLNEPGEKDWHGYLLKYDNPVDLALKEFTFFHVNLAISFLNKILGKLQYLKTQNNTT